MNRQKELAKNTIILTVGKICTQFVSFLLLPLYTSLLAPEEYGIVDLVNTYIVLLTPIFNWQFENGLFRFLLDYRNDEYKKKYTRPMIAATTRTRYHVFCFCVSRKKASMNIAIKIPVVEVETSMEAATRKAKSICLSLSRKKRGTNMKHMTEVPKRKR